MAEPCPGASIIWMMSLTLPSVTICFEDCCQHFDLVHVTVCQDYPVVSPFDSIFTADSFGNCGRFAFESKNEAIFMFQFGHCPLGGECWIMLFGGCWLLRSGGHCFGVHLYSRRCEVCT